MHVASLLLLACLLASSASFPTGAKLLHIQALWRHGDRTPVATYPTDPHQEDSWPVPWGELTTKGMWQHYQQGLKLKEEYIEKAKFISGNYSINEIYIRSSDVTRNLMSAYSNMAGFYSNSKGTHPQEKQWPATWSPVPVHTVPKDIDFAIWALPYCPRMAQLQKDQFESPEFVGAMDRNKDLFQLIEENGKMKITDFWKLYTFANTLMIERYHNMTLPEWITEDVYGRSKAMANQGFDFLYGGPAFGKEEDVEMISLSGGELIKDMIANIEKKISGQNKLLYQVYSGHDSTVAGLLRTLGNKEAVLGDDHADYASVVVLELWEVAKDDFSVRVRYSKNAETPFVTITQTVHGCPKAELCPLEAFVENRQKYIVKDIQKACESKEEYDIPF
ncbi:hypothetical protein QR680_008690 [Steinernema hermaphroditum]|uniref:Acid phosphatase n=1 Tax=Steinernema hermaphroditum TaxID=289476 RepID=A0AA39IJH3_9BILA|nr:hypothetical protein QR680_008690 [Steinernema hermaphroditum]